MAESIRARLLSCQDEATEGRDRVKAIETYLANLQPHPYRNMEADRQELERMLKEARADVDRVGRRCDEIQDEARKANIPAGWIR
jgi:predicted nuclease with TOPRIM domain